MSWFPHVLALSRGVCKLLTIACAGYEIAWSSVASKRAVTSNKDKSQACGLGRRRKRAVWPSCAHEERGAGL